MTALSHAIYGSTTWDDIIDGDDCFLEVTCKSMTCDDKGVWIRDPGAPQLNWHPNSELEAPFAHDPRTTPNLPFRFSAAHLAAFMLDGVGAFIQERFGPMGGMPDEDELNAFPPEALTAKHAIESAYQAYHEALAVVGPLSPSHNLRVNELSAIEKTARQEARAKLGFKKMASSTTYKEAVAATRQASSDADTAHAKWRKKMVQHLLNQGCNSLGVTAKAHPAESCFVGSSEGYATPVDGLTIFDHAELTDDRARYWLALDGWTPEQAAHLLCCVAPYPHLLENWNRTPAFDASVQVPYEAAHRERMNFLGVAGETGVLTFPAKPEVVIQWAMSKGMRLPAPFVPAGFSVNGGRWVCDALPMSAPSHQSTEAESHVQPPKDEAEALRRCLAILAPTHTPLERKQMALNAENRISGQDTALLVYSFGQIGTLFHPNDANKAKLLAERLRDAVDGGELATVLPPEHGRVAISELASWPECPPIPDESPLRYWLPSVFQELSKAVPRVQKATPRHHPFKGEPASATGERQFFVTEAWPRCVPDDLRELVRVSPDGLVDCRQEFGHKTECRGAKAIDYLEEIDGRMQRQAEGFFTVDEAAHVLAHFRQGVNAHQWAKDMQKAHRAGALAIRHCHTRAPMLPCNPDPSAIISALWTAHQDAARSFLDLVLIEDINDWLMARKVGYAFPSASQSTLESTHEAQQEAQADRQGPGTSMTTRAKEARQARRYQMCLDAKLSMPDNDYAPMPRGIGAVAKKEGITRQAFVEDVKAYINRSNGR